MRKVYISDAARLPMGLVPGIYSGMTKTSLAHICLEKFSQKNNWLYNQVDEVLFTASGSEGDYNIGRKIVISSVIGEGANVVMLDKTCASGLEAIQFAKYKILNNECDVSLVCSVDCVSDNSFYLKNLKDNIRQMVKHSQKTYDEMFQLYNDEDMGFAAEIISRIYGISIEEQNQFAELARIKAKTAKKNKLFSREILPVEINGVEYTCDEVLLHDEMQMNSEIHNIYIKDGCINAINSARLCDNAQAIVLVSSDFAEKTGCPILAEVGASCGIGLPRAMYGQGMIFAVEKLLERTGKNIFEDIGLVECNDAYAAQSIAFLKKYDVGLKYNLSGGSLALGYPVYGSGLRSLISSVHRCVEDKTEMGLVASCGGAGMGMAIYFRTIY